MPPQSPVPLPKPDDMFARDWEWSELTAFASDNGPEATIGVVSGRRRQGKSFLLDSLARSADGFYFCGYEATEAESLRRFGEELGQYLGTVAPMRFDRWEEAVDALLELGKERPLPVVIDEFPYLARATPSLPSIVQVAYGPRRPERMVSRTRLLLCGSSLSFMGKLLSGTSPLRGRAGLELVVHPLDYRQAAAFWDIEDRRLAVLVHVRNRPGPGGAYELRDRCRRTRRGRPGQRRSALPRRGQVGPGDGPRPPGQTAPGRLPAGRARP
jgi:uncharacterized protein